MRVLSGASLALLGVAVATSTCGGSAFTEIGGNPDASMETGGSGSGGSGSSSGAGASGGNSGAGSGSGSGARSGSASGSSSGTGGSGSSSGTGGSGSSSGTGGSGSSSGSAAGCDASCGAGRHCCEGKCVNTANDPLNCGGCGVACTGSTPFCEGSCKPEPCTKEGGTCGVGATCCGNACCGSGQLCCLPEGPLDRGPMCETPTGSPATCPQGCAPLCVSDRNLKRDIQPVDERAVLAAVAQMPVSSWSYKSDDPSVRHLGPMAQDFYSAFRLGDTDRAYDPIDAHGVALAAIKALAEQVQEQNARIESLERENRELKGRAACGP